MGTDHRTTSARRVIALLLTAALAAPLAACTGSDVPAPDATAKALVAGLQSGSLDGVKLAQDTSGDPQEQLTEILKPLLGAAGTEHPEVSLAEVVTAKDGDDADRRATATLKWSWQLGRDANWTYVTRTELTYADPPQGSDGAGSWSVAWSPSVLVPDLQPGERLTVKTVQAKRGAILDGAGEPLVTSRDVWRVGIDKTHAGQGQWETSARSLAALATAGGVTVDADAYARRVLSAGPKAFVELVTVRQDAPGIDIDGARQIPGAGVIAATAQLAPTATFAKAILGGSGEATAEIIEQSKGRVRRGDITGLSGLQKQYDAQLAGSPGVVVTAAKPGDAAEPRGLFSKVAVDGTSLQTTFDVALQERAEQVLSGVGPASAIVAIRPSTGEVLAAASGPGSNGLDTALLGKYAPGSTFKVIDALALGRKGVTPDTTLPCTPTITVNGREFQNVPGYPASALGDIPLRTAIAQSCNTAMISQHDVVSQGDLVAAATDLGLGVQTPVGAPAFYGNVPSDATPAQHAATLIGQDRVEASPFTMARVAASVAAGKRVDPVLVRPAAAGTGTATGTGTGASPSVSPPVSPSVSPAASASPSPVPDSKLTAEEAATLRDLMAGVVASGSATMLKDVPGIVGAKTGTAQFGDGTQAHTWMIAIAGDLAVAVFVEVGDLGSTTSGPLMRAFLTGP